MKGIKLGHDDMAKALETQYAAWERKQAAEKKVALATKELEESNRAWADAKDRVRAIEREGKDVPSVTRYEPTWEVSRPVPIKPVPIKPVESKPRGMLRTALSVVTP